MTLTIFHKTDGAEFLYTKRVVDTLMTVTLMLLMSLQTTEHVAHEYLGVFMFVLFIIHQYLNRMWYGALFRGKYNLPRIFSTVVNFSLLVSFLMTVFSGVIMSENFPSLNIESLTSFARLTHLSCSYLSFVLMGIHLGLHWGIIAGRVKHSWPKFIAIIISGYGLYVFMCAEIFDYIFLVNQFAFIDYDKNFLLAILENISMLSFWTMVGFQTGKVLTGKYITPCLTLLLTGGVYVIFRMWLGVPEPMF